MIRDGQTPGFRIKAGQIDPKLEQSPHDSTESQRNGSHAGADDFKQKRTHVFIVEGLPVAIVAEATVKSSYLVVACIAYECLHERLRRLGS